MVTLNEALLAYRTAMQIVMKDLSARETENAASHVLQVLRARDVVLRALSDTQVLTSEIVSQLRESDEQLRSSAPDIATKVRESTLANWREMFQPSEGAWWWSLDKLAAAAQPKSSPLWAIPAGFFITGSLSVTTDILHHFLSAGPDWFGVLSTLLQALLALVSGSTFTPIAQKWVERGLSRLRFKPDRYGPCKSAFALFVLIFAVVFRFSLPFFANIYNDLGVGDQRAGRMTGAIENYQRAIGLSPDFAPAHYNLATAYEDIVDYDKAVSEYQIAIRTDSRIYLAYNNLARLYILRKNDFASALALLNAAFELPFSGDPSQDMLVRYSLFKNRGWANLGLKYLRLAEADLREALALRADGASAHCLLAQVLEAQANPKSALAEWEACLRYEKGEVVEANWLGLAKERLSEGESK